MQKIKFSLSLGNILFLRNNTFLHLAIIYSE